MTHGKFTYGSTVLAAAALLMLAGSSTAFADPPGHAKGNPPPHAQGKKAPLVLESHGQFWAGGEIVTRSYPVGTSNLTSVNQAYVEYFIPQKKRKNAYPIVMTHTSINSTIFLSTPDGREGWVDFFLRQGFPVYIIDPPGTGRAGFPVDQYNLVRAGDADPSSQPSLGQRDSFSWPNENMGPEFGSLGPVDPTCIGNDGRGDPPVTCHGWRMPNDEESLKQWLAHGLPIGQIPGDRNESFIAVLDKIGSPVIWLGWSAGGSLGGTLVNDHPELFKGLIGIEPSNNCMWDEDTPGSLTPVLEGNVQVPAMSIHSINQIGRPSEMSPVRRLSKADCEAIYQAINDAGGNAMWIDMYEDLGIYGNSHMMFWEDNNDEVAQALLDWINDNVE